MTWDPRLESASQDYDVFCSLHPEELQDWCLFATRADLELLGAAVSKRLARYNHRALVKFMYELRFTLDRPDMLHGFVTVLQQLLRARARTDG